MQAGNPAYRIEILGINSIGAEADNVAYAAGTTLAWLQDVAEQDVRSAWGATSRDVYILDPTNEIFAVYNLLTNSLDLLANRDALKALFLQAAGWVDSDNDTLCDYWEKRHFGNLSNGPTDDPDGDGKDNFSEYSFGTDPLDAASCSSIQSMVVEQGGDPFLEVGFARRMGSQVAYWKRTSTDLASWGAPGPGIVSDEPLQNLFDGTGTGRAVFRTASPVSGALQRFFRMVALPGNPSGPGGPN